MASNGSVKYEMRLDFSQRRGANPVSFGAPDAGETVELDGVVELLIKPTFLKNQIFNGAALNYLMMNSFNRVGQVFWCWQSSF
jgi:hypothetical protein